MGEVKEEVREEVQEKEQKVLSCNICSETFVNDAMLRNHCREKHVLLQPNQLLLVEGEEEKNSSIGIGQSFTMDLAWREDLA